MKKHKIDVLEGIGSLAGKGRVTVDGNDVETDKVVLATGRCRSRSPARASRAGCSTPPGMWLLNEQPARLAVVGAGASGAEIASAFGRFGTEVVLIEMLDQILPLEDAEIAKVVARELKKQNIKVVDGRARREGEGRQGLRRDRLGRGRAELRLPVHRRRPRARRRGRSASTRPGVKTGERGLVEVDERHADLGRGRVGDRRPRARPGARAQGLGRGHHRRRGRCRAASRTRSYYEDIPRRHVLPAAGGELRPHRGGGARARRRRRGRESSRWAASAPPTVYGDRKGMVKIVGDARYGELLGAHIVGARATEMIAELVVAKQLEGGFEEVARTVHPHPTFSEAVMEGARADRRLGHPRLS